MLRRQRCRMISTATDYNGAVHGLNHFFQKRGFHFYQMSALWEAAVIHIGDVFAERGDALLLEAFVFGGEVTVGFGVAGRALGVVAEDVVGEKKLGVAAGA